MKHDYFAIREKMSEQEQYDFLNDMIDEYGVETYDDYANMTAYLSLACRCIYNTAEELDDVEKSNLLALEKLLKACAGMFVVCDDYYRYGKLARENRPERFRDDN